MRVEARACVPRHCRLSSRPDQAENGRSGKCSLTEMDSIKAVPGPVARRVEIAEDIPPKWQVADRETRVVELNCSCLPPELGGGVHVRRQDEDWLLRRRWERAREEATRPPAGDVTVPRGHLQPRRQRWCRPLLTGRQKTSRLSRPQRWAAREFPALAAVRRHSQTVALRVKISQMPSARPPRPRSAVSLRRVPDDRKTTLCHRGLFRSNRTSNPPAAVTANRLCRP